jgi:hypothetical protein
MHRVTRNECRLGRGLCERRRKGIAIGSKANERTKAQRVRGNKADKLKLSLNLQQLDNKYRPTTEDYRPSVLPFAPVGLPIGCLPGRVMVRSMRMCETIAGEVMNDAWMIELQKQIASVGATCIGITFCWYCLHFDSDRGKLDDTETRTACF